VLHREHIYGSGPPNEIPNEGILDILTKWAGSSVLDVGCGIGVYTAALQARGINAIGIEVDARYVDRARDLGRSVQLYDGVTIPFDDRSFETVIAIEVLEHVPGWEALLREMIRVASATVVISVPNIGVLPAMSRYLVGPWHLLEATHVNFFTRDILTEVLRRHFSDVGVDVSEYGLFEINGEIFANHLLAVLRKAV
jgi:2-polyprenyl-3-methyl-5-hydroxy-6-metoxy-1,4-benzoquinol methylase